MSTWCQVWQVSDISKGRGKITYFHTCPVVWNYLQVVLCSWSCPHNSDAVIVHHSFHNFLYQPPTSHFEGKWRLEKKNWNPASKFVTYILTWSFSHASHRSQSQFIVPNRLRYGITISSDRILHTATTHMGTVLKQQKLTLFPTSFSTVTSSFSTVMDVSDLQCVFESKRIEIRSH